MPQQQPMNLIVLQHAEVEHPGIFSNFFNEDGFRVHTVELDHGETIPELDPFDVMIVMGGPQDVWQEDEHPWFRPEKAAIRKFVTEMQRPYLGICLGHQLLADALGGKVAPGKIPEVGVMPVAKTEDGRTDEVVANLSNPLQVLQWHGAEVTELPPGGTVLVSSDACRIQALRVGKNAYGFQFHVEVTSRTVTDWAAIPEYARALERAMGPDGMEQLGSQVSNELTNFSRNARILYDGLKKVWME
ncbi:MAG TPA: type 1 glutamine amidotransferase [Methyloceanibacter sp.]|nr:type 1 glutamine amidotransferase [Methyloceanibacter sp.]